jgi:predicted adenylyl cyclase CyaB
MSDSILESELKFPVIDLDQMRLSLQRARAVVVRTMARETNLLLDTEDKRLRTAGCVLRLRRHGDRKTFTFKGPVSYKGAIKERPEHETEIADLDRMGDILSELGFSVYMRYEKDREEWLLGDVMVVLDHTPMGAFVEVEGEPDKLPEVADLLGLKISSALRGSYASLWLDHRKCHPELGLPFDMVFSE